MPYTLRCSICAHSSDVRALTTMENCIISGSRDRQVILWTENETFYERTTTMSVHTGFISSLCVLSPNELFPEGLIFSGGHDNKIFGFKPYTTEPSITFLGHSGPVCCLTPSKTRKKQLISSSWDCTAKLWDIASEQCITTFSGHNQAVWCTLHTPEDFVITGSADKLIKIFSNYGECIMTLEGHTDCVRGLAYAGSVEVFSCSNDGTVRKWNINSGDCLDIIFCQNDYIYSIAVFESLIAFGGEGNSLSVLSFSDNSTKQAIQVPATSVWSVAFLPNSDIVAGTSDGSFRIFTRDISRAAGKESKEEYVKEINSFVKTAATKDSTELPGKDALQLDGTFEGELKFISDAGLRYCYRWSGISGSWKLMKEACLELMPNNIDSSELDSRIFYPPERHVFFEQYDSELILSKTKEFMSLMNFSSKDKNEVLDSFSELISKDNPQLNNVQVSEKYLITAINEWPEEYVFPVLDIIRISLLNKAENCILLNCENSKKLFESLNRFIQPDALEINKIFFFRILANMFSSESGENEVLKQLHHIFKIIPEVVIGKCGRLEVAFATFVLNSSLLSYKKMDEVIAKVCVDCVSRMITKIGEPEAVFRLLVALGTLTLMDNVRLETKNMLDILQDISNWNRDDRASVKASTCASCILRDFYRKVA